MVEMINKFFSNVFTVISNITVIDVIDIVCVTTILFFLYKFVKGRRAGKLALGIILFFVILIICNIAGMSTMSYIFSNLLQVGLIALVVVFQPELRIGLEKMGNNPIIGIKNLGISKEYDSIEKTIEEVTTACNEMSLSKTGALIVFERKVKLDEIVMTGTIINANPSSYLIRNIFFNKSPLHDGAVLVRSSRIYAASCLLPLSERTDLNQELGTRHRAAIGLSEDTDAVVIVVSEETGIISIALNGNIERNLTSDELKFKLKDLLINRKTKKNKLNSTGE